MDTYIFGSKATAAGLYKALSVLEPEKEIKAFLVSNPEENVPEIWGCPVKGLKQVAEDLSLFEKKEAEIYVAVPELIHKEIKELLNGFGFCNLVMLDSRSEAKVMEQFFEAEGKFRTLHSLHLLSEGKEIPKITIYAASFYKDKPLENTPKLLPCIKKLYLGCEGATKNGIDLRGQADFYDNSGDNISIKNPNLCEMTAHYWVWKNRLDTDDEYVGICHYRRMLDIDEKDMERLGNGDVDVVLPFPMVHYPNALIHHTWYVSERDWGAMRLALKELHPEYEQKMDEVFQKPWIYNYNMLLAKKKVFADYCAWLYPVMERIEEILEPEGEKRADRYAGYLCENLETLYFLLNYDDLNIVHTGRLLFT